MSILYSILVVYTLVWMRLFTDYTCKPAQTHGQVVAANTAEYTYIYKSCTIGSSLRVHQGMLDVSNEHGAD